MKTVRVPIKIVFQKSLHGKNTYYTVTRLQTLIKQLHLVNCFDVKVHKKHCSYSSIHTKCLIHD